MADSVSINWHPEHRRSLEIAEIVGCEPFFVRSEHRFLPARYIAQALTTWRILRSNRPVVIVVMQPPPVLLMAVLPYILRRRPLVIGDLHSGVFFDPKWAWLLKFVLRILKKNGGAIVPNIELAVKCEKRGVTTFVSHGLIKPIEARPLLDGASDSTGPYLLVPLTYARDEPIAAILEAARMTPELSWVLTGRAPDKVKSAAPSNVSFPGFVSNEQYLEMRLRASAVFALTTQDSTMQSAGYEALASGTPLVTANTKVLRDFFKDGAIYVDNSPTKIASSAREVLARGAAWTTAIEAVRKSVVSEQSAVQDAIRAWVHECRHEKSTTQ